MSFAQMSVSVKNSELAFAYFRYCTGASGLNAALNSGVKDGKEGLLDTYVWFKFSQFFIYIRVLCVLKLQRLNTSTFFSLAPAQEKQVFRGSFISEGNFLNIMLQES